MKRFRKFLSFMVVTAMLLGLIPMTAFAKLNEPLGITYDSAKKYLYANGNPILIKEVDGNTYVYDISGTTKQFEKPLEEVYYVFGGAETSTVASTKIIMESGNIGTRTTAKKGYLYAGGGGNVEGLAEVKVNGGYVDTVYGSGTGITGSVRIEYNNSSSSLQALICGSRGIVSGNVDIILDNPKLTTLCGGSNGGTAATSYVGGDINITVNGGSITNIYGGCTTGKVYGEVNITINGDTEVSGAFHPMRKTYNNLVDGGASVYVPESFNTDIIKTTYNDGSPNNDISIFKNGVQIYGPAKVTSDANGNVFANGVSVIIKTNEADGNTYMYNKLGTKQLLKFPIDNYTIYGGSNTESALGANITMESGRVSAIYGGGLNGTVTGETFININSGLVGNVYAGGLNGKVNSTAYVKLAEGAIITGETGAIRTGNSKASVIWVPENFDMSKINKDENSRIFKGIGEVPDTSIIVPSTVTKQGNYIFANGIPIVIKKDTSNERTYIYDAAGINKLLNAEVNGHEIFGGSAKGVVASTNISMESGTVARIYGGGRTSCVTGTAKVSVTGGDITEVIYGGSYDGDVGSTDIYTFGPCVAKGVNAGSRNGSVLGATKVILIDSVAKGLYLGTAGDERIGYPSSDVFGNVSLTLDGGMAEKIYGGCKSGVVRGSSTITIKKQAIIKSGVMPLGIGGVLGAATVIVPENYLYMNKITTGEGINIQLTEAVEPEAAPVMFDNTEEVMSREGDAGKLVFRFLDLPAPEGELMGRFGEAIYITFPNGKNMLVDAAATETRDLLIGTLKQMNVTKLDYVVATHYHSDHIGGLYKILDEFEVGTLYKPGFNIPSGAQDYYTELKARIDNPNKTFIAADLWRGDVINIGDVNIEVLNPVNSDSVKTIMNGVPSTEDANNNSIVMKMTYGENTALFLGDLYTEGEINLLNAYRGTNKLRAELIKVAHHGDTTSSDPEFVAAVAPEIAVLTHFSDTIIVNNRYKAVGADTYVTGVDGITKVIFDGAQAEVITQFYVQE